MDELKKFISDHDDLCILSSDKIQCISTSHEFKAIPDDNEDCKVLLQSIKIYLNGKKYKLAKSYASSFDQYEHITPNKKHPKKLFCEICHIPLNKIQKQIEDHINGRKHQCRIKELTVIDKKDSIPDQMAEEFGEEDNKIQSDSESTIIQTTTEDTFEIVSSDQNIINDTTKNMDYNSSSDDEDINLNDGFLVGKKRKSKFESKQTRKKIKK